MFDSIKKSAKFIWQHAWTDKRSSKILAASTATAVGVSIILNVASPAIFHYITDALSPLLDGGVLLGEGAMLVASYGVFWGVKNISRLIRSGALYAESNEIGKNMGLAIAEKAFKQKLIKADDIAADAIVNSVEKAYDSVDMVVQRGTSNFIQNLIEMSVIAGYLTYRFSPVFLLGIASTTSVYILYTVKLIPSMMDRRKQFVATYKKSREDVFDLLTHAESIKNFGKEYDSTQLIETSLRERNSSYARYATKSVIIQSGQVGIVGTGIAGLMLYALMSYHHLGVKELAKIMSFLLQFGDLFENFGTTISQFDAAFRGINELRTVHDNLPVIEDSKHAKNLKLNPTDQVKITFLDVALFFEKEAKKISLLSNLNFTLKSGSVTALVGHSGAGKSTIAKLLLRHNDPNDGSIQIEINGQVTDIREYKTQLWRQSIAFLTQGKDTPIFKKSLEDNIKFSCSLASLDEIQTVIELSQLKLLMNKLPKGAQTILGAGSSTNLSGGERKLIALSRFFLNKSARICVLDEPTSDLDPQTAKFVMSNISQFIKGKTVLLITHDLEYAYKVSDQVIVLEQGKIKKIDFPNANKQAGGQHKTTNAFKFFTDEKNEADAIATGVGRVNNPLANGTGY